MVSIVHVAVAVEVGELSISQDIGDYTRVDSTAVDVTVAKLDSRLQFVVSQRLRQHRSIQIKLVTK